MLTYLEIENIAVIEHLSIDLKNRMSVLTGETGAGKSIIIDSINLILGGRTDKTLVRHESQKARVQAVFDVDLNTIRQLNEFGIELEETQLIISREITSDGKSICRINGVLTTLAVLKAISEQLVNIHGQHDNQALLNPSRHIEFLDKFAKCDDLREEYSIQYHEVRLIQDEIEKLTLNENERIQKIDLLRYQNSEIEEAHLKEGEDDELIQERNQISNAEQIAVSVGKAYANLYEDSAVQPAYDGISIAVKSLESVASLSESLGQIYEKLSDMMYNLEDYAHELKEYADGIDYNESRLNEIEERLYIISRLKRKYGGSIAEILKFHQDVQTQLSNLDSSEETLLKLEKEKEEKIEKLLLIGSKLTEVRKKASMILQSEVEQSLAELDMKGTKFCVSLSSCKEFRSSGLDEVEFLISTNTGEPLKPLVKIASGGELSRIMLAMKAILADVDEVDTLIFDEIDTGVSGSAAQKIANKLSYIARAKQVICITHSPAIAAMANYHYLIHKQVENDKTSTNLVELNLENRRNELARIIGGENITDVALKHAQEMLDYAKNSKI